MIKNSKVSILLLLSLTLDVEVDWAGRRGSGGGLFQLVRDKVVDVIIFMFHLENDQQISCF